MREMNEAEFVNNMNELVSAVHEKLDRASLAFAKEEAARGVPIGAIASALARGLFETTMGIVLHMQPDIRPDAIAAMYGIMKDLHEEFPLPGTETEDAKAANQAGTKTSTEGA